MSFTSALFITENKLKKTTVINENVDTSLLTPYIKIAQEQYIRPILGEALYDDLASSIVANDLTANETTLLNKISEPLAYYTFYSAIPFIATQISNKGVLVKNSDNNSISADNARLDLLTKRIQNIADHYASRLKDYLDDNASLFPLYRDYTISGQLKDKYVHKNFTGLQF